MFAVSFSAMQFRYALILGLALQSGAAVAQERFTLNAEQDIVTDHQTGLRWQRDGLSKTTNLNKAKEYCNSLVLGANNKWRLPEVKEMISLVDELHYKPASFPIFETLANLYWSNTKDIKRPGLSWTINFSDGHVHAFHEDLDFSVRCVAVD